MPDETEWAVPPILDELVVPVDPPDFGLEHYLTYRISRVSRLLDSQTARFLAENFGVSITGRRSLAHLANRGPSTLRDIAANLQIDKGAVSRALTSLSSKGYAIRSDDPNDGRSAIFSITPTGRALETDIVQKGLARQVELLNQLQPDERRSLYTALGKLRDFLDVDRVAASRAIKDAA